MTVYLFANRKGGVGKTTSAVNLAVYLATKGKTLLIDADDQKSAYTWFDYREAEDLDCVYLQGDLDDLIRQHSKTYEYIIIDCAGRDSKEFRSSLKVADKLFIPTQTSQADLDVLPFVTDLVDRTQAQTNPKLEKYFFISRASTHAKSKDADNTSTFLAEKYPTYKVMKARLHERVQFREAFAQSKSVLELKPNNAKDDFNNWLLEVI